MKTTVYFIRHGAVANPENVLYGRLPGFPLSMEGRLMAEKLAKLFSKKEISAVYTSPQLRCRQTARPLALFLNLPFHLSRLIQEVGSDFDGIGKDEFEKIEPDISDSKALLNYRRESVEDVQQRMTLFVKRMTKRYPGLTIAAVSHGDPIVILRAFLEGKSFNWDYKKNNYVPIGGYCRILV